MVALSSCCSAPALLPTTTCARPPDDRATSLPTPAASRASWPVSSRKVDEEQAKDLANGQAGLDQAFEAAMSGEAPPPAPAPVAVSGGGGGGMDEAALQRMLSQFEQRMNSKLQAIETLVKQGGAASGS